MQIKVTASLLLALGFITGVVWLFASQADAQVGAALQGSASALPGPRSLVVFDSLPANGGSPTVFVPSSGSVTVASVPPNRWLVITDYDQTYGFNVDLVEDLAGVITVKRHEMMQSSGQVPIDRFHSSIGMSFAPGSQVVLRNRGVQNANMTYHLAGYWVVQ